MLQCCTYILLYLNIELYMQQLLLCATQSLFTCDSQPGLTTQANNGISPSTYQVLKHVSVELNEEKLVLKIIKHDNKNYHKLFIFSGISFGL